MYCQVIVDIVHENVAHTFTYRVPEQQPLCPGTRVLVPFGSRQLEGIVLSLTEQADLPPEKIRSVIRPLEDYPAVLPPMIRLAEQMAETAHCPLAETLRLMLPAQMRGERVKVKTCLTACLLLSPDQTREAILAETRSPKRRKLLELLSDMAPHRVEDLRMSVRDPGEALKNLADRGLIALREEEVLRRPDNAFRAERTEAPSLTPAQEEALSEILPTLSGKPGKFLLHGVTGSGKTEVFMAAAAKTMAMGKTAIILVPEIALTPQMVTWFRNRFGDEAAVLHSRLSPGERFDEWRRIRLGKARVIIGARSAVFAPTEELGLIVVDEEHENTYLNDHRPRYDARDVAAARCDLEGATLLLASATPSILSFARARRGDYILLEMPRRVNNRPLPEVQVVDMRKELDEGNRSVFSSALKQALVTCVKDGHQAMLLMNHRGYHSFVSCRHCGYTVKCPQCDVAMTYHVGDESNLLRCHYCGYTQPPPVICPACGSRYIRYFGAGTQKVEEEVHRLLPGTVTVRMDTDTTSGKDSHSQLLDIFRSGQARVLIGTQMIAKGLDFPRVTLVGIVAADLTLNLPDYRSRERTFQLLTQAAGRAGRGMTPGQVIVQTYKPEDPVILQAAAQDYRAFFETEFDRRRKGLYPPFTVLARLLVEAAEEQTAAHVAEDLYRQVLHQLEEHPAWKSRTLLLLLDRPGVKVLRGRQRYHVLMKLLTHPVTEEFCGELSAMAHDNTSAADVWFEYNPVTMM